MKKEQLEQIKIAINNKHEDSLTIYEINKRITKEIEKIEDRCCLFYWPLQC